MGEADTVLEQGGGRFPELRPNIIGGDSVGPLVWVGDVGDDSVHQEGVGQIPPQGGPQTEREATPEKERRSVDTTPAGGRDYGSRNAVGIIATRPIMDLCLAAKCRPVPRIYKRWWEQDGVDMEGRREAAQEAERTELEEETGETEAETETD